MCYAIDEFSTGKFKSTHSEDFQTADRALSVNETEQTLSSCLGTLYKTSNKLPLIISFLFS